MRCTRDGVCPAPDRNQSRGTATRGPNAAPGEGMDARGRATQEQLPDGAAGCTAPGTVSAPLLIRKQLALRHQLPSGIRAQIEGWRHMTALIRPFGPPSPAMREKGTTPDPLPRSKAGATATTLIRPFGPPSPAMREKGTTRGPSPRSKAGTTATALIRPFGPPSPAMREKGTTPDPLPRSKAGVT